MDYYNGTLWEYDIMAAAYHITMNVVAPLNLVKPERIREIESNKNFKKERNILIGKLQKDYPEIKSLYTQTYEDVLNGFMTVNNITVNNIMYKTKDSLIVNKECNNLIMGNFTFRLINKYNFLVRYDKNKVVFFSNDTMTVKGAKDFVNKNKGLFKWFERLAILFLNSSSTKELFVQFKRLDNIFKGSYLDSFEDEDSPRLNLDNLIIEAKFKYIEDEWKKNITVDDFYYGHFREFAKSLLQIK